MRPDRSNLTPRPPLLRERGSLTILKIIMRREADEAGLNCSHFHAFMTDAERWGKLKEFARGNRNVPTKAENALWQELRGNKLGPRFRRQHAIAQYIVDFVCLSAWLIIEVDGEYHATDEQTN